MSEEDNSKEYKNKVVDIVHILWNDACEGDLMEDVKMSRCNQETVGFLVEEDINNVYTARDWDTLNEEFNQVLRIPKLYIVSMKRLKLF